MRREPASAKILSTAQLPSNTSVSIKQLNMINSAALLAMRV